VGERRRQINQEEGRGRWGRRGREEGIGERWGQRGSRGGGKVGQMGEEGQMGGRKGGGKEVNVNITAMQFSGNHMTTIISKCSLTTSELIGAILAVFVPITHLSLVHTAASDAYILVWRTPSNCRGVWCDSVRV